MKRIFANLWIKLFGVKGQPTTMILLDRCPNCCSDDVDRCHHSATFALPECFYYQCNECDTQWGHSYAVVKENEQLNKALALKLDSLPSGLTTGQAKALEEKYQRELSAANAKLAVLEKFECLECDKLKSKLADAKKVGDELKDVGSHGRWSD